MRRGLLILVLAVLGCVGCHHDKGFENEFLKEETVCLRIAGQDVFVYDPLNCQLSYNESRSEFRVGTDTMSDYFMLRLSAAPVEPRQVIDRCVLEWTTEDDTRSLKNLSFTVKKVDDSGLVWLWCKPSKVFAIVRIL